MLIAQISDPHVTTEGTAIRALVDTPGRLADALQSLAALPHTPDVILLTGDLVNDGAAAEYDLLAEVLAHAPCPVMPIPGNHDDPDLLRASFAAAEACPFDLPPAGEPFHYVVDRYPVRLIALDSTRPGHHSGLITDESAAWLDATLTADPDRPTIVLMHHTPYPTGAWWFDYNGVAGAPLLRATLERHTHVLRVVAGHVHQASSTQWGPLTLSTAPSTAFLSGTGSLDPTAEVPPLIVDQRSTVPLLWWNGESLLATEAPLPIAAPSIDVRSINSNWADYEPAARAGGPISKEQFGG